MSSRSSTNEPQVVQRVTLHCTTPWAGTLKCGYVEPHDAYENPQICGNSVNEISMECLQTLDHWKWCGLLRSQNSFRHSDSDKHILLWEGHTDVHSKRIDPWQGQSLKSSLFLHLLCSLSCPRIHQGEFEITSSLWYVFQGFGPIKILCFYLHVYIHV